ncbi:UNVERIFIED_CONTAM: hypothetical protein NCL1_60334 [Trichonephila clavipes]
MNFEDLNGVFQELSCIPADPPAKRELCTRCSLYLENYWITILNPTLIPVYFANIIYSKESHLKKNTFLFRSK